MPARRFVPEKTICADVGLHGMDIHLGEVYAQAPRSDPASAKALRCGQSLSARPLERRIYPVVSPGAIATRRDVPCTQVNPVSGLSTSLEEILRKELLQTLDSVDTGQAGPLAFGSQGVPRRALEHYSMEIVANLAVWLGGECQVGQMIDWFGSYDRTSGLSARLLLRKPANEGSERDFQVSAKRRFERLSSSIDTLESGND